MTKRVIELLQDAQTSVIALEMMAGKPDKEGDSVANKNIVRAISMLEADASTDRLTALREKVENLSVWHSDPDVVLISRERVLAEIDALTKAGSAQASEGMKS